MLRQTAQWVRRLDETGRDQTRHLVLHLHEPLGGVPDATLETPSGDDPEWRLSFHLSAADEDEQSIDAECLWDQSLGGAPTGQRLGELQELLLTELTRAARVYERLEPVLHEGSPSELMLTTKEACALVREHRPLLAESGIVVTVPRWWDDPAGRLGVRLQVESPESEGGGASTVRMGLSTIVQYRWQIAIGDQPLTLEEFQRLSEARSPLVQVRGNWVELRPEDMDAAKKFLRDNEDGEMTLLAAIHAAHGSTPVKTGLPVFGLDATGWVKDLLAASSGDQNMPVVKPPRDFRGELRPYQITGLSWLAFLDQFGLGACLADDMGLGKTIQLIALLQHEREHAPPGTTFEPTLLVAPTSVITNWTRELARFAPNLTFHVQHGPDRPTGEQLAEKAATHDLVITTYALVTRDHDSLLPHCMASGGAR